LQESEMYRSKYKFWAWEASGKIYLARSILCGSWHLWSCVEEMWWCDM